MGQYTVVYEYGARLNKECLMDVEDQFNKARRLYNNMIEIIRKARQEADEYLRRNSPDVAAKMVVIEILNHRFMVAKAENDEPAMKESIAERKSAWLDLKPYIREARKEHKDEISKIFEVVGMRKECLTYQARCAAVEDGLGWATADEIHVAALRAWDKVRKDGGNLCFRSERERTEDHIINRLTTPGGVHSEALLSGKISLVELIPPKEIGDRKYGQFKFRLGNARQGKVAAGTWQFHRPFLPESKVSVIRLVRRKVGPEIRWYLQFQLSIPELPKLARVADERLCAVHLGFSLADNGLICYGAMSANGKSEMLYLPENIPLDLYRSEQIQKIRAEARDRIHAKLKSMSFCNVLHDILEEVDAIRKLPAQYVSAERIKQLSRRLEQHGVVSEDALNLKQYTIDDHWKYIQERNIHRRALNRRKNHYREESLRLATRYKVIVIGRYDIAKMAMKIDLSGERNDLSKIARHSRFAVAMYQFISCLQWACDRAGSVLIEERDLKYARKCSKCDTVFERESDSFECECGAVSDIKANASATLYKIYAEGTRAEQEAENIKKLEAEKHAKYLHEKEGKMEMMQKRKIEIASLRAES